MSIIIKEKKRKTTPSLYKEQFPGSIKFAKMIKEDRASTPFWVRYQEFEENKDIYKDLFTPIVRKRGK